MPLPVVKQINDLLWYLHRRQERRWLRRKVGWWERKRAAGRTRFVWTYALGWGLSMALFLLGWGYIIEGRFSLAIALMLIALGMVLGWWTGSSAWTDNERLYERAQQGGGSEEARVRGE